jgi:hypothetical protein
LILLELRRNAMRLTLIVGLCLVAAACSRADQTKVGGDARAAGHDLANAAREVPNDPNLRRAGADAKQTAQDTAAALRKTAAEAERKSGQALIDTGEKAKHAADTKPDNGTP